MDVTARIKTIELLKCALLTDLAALYENLRKPADGGERNGLLAALLINVYLLAGRLGVDYQKLDEEAVLTLRREILSGTARPDMESLIKFLGRDSE